MNEKSRLKEKVITPIFLASSSVCFFLAIMAVVTPAKLNEVLTAAMFFFEEKYMWVYLIAPFGCGAVALTFGLLPKFRDIRFGGKNAKKEYSTFAWLGMLFTASVGVGTVYFALVQSLFALELSPWGRHNPQLDIMEAGRNAMGLGLYGWSTSAWAIFCISGMIASYFMYHKKSKLMPGEALRLGFADKKWSGAAGHAMNWLGIMSSCLTISASIGLGCVQMGGAITKLFNLSETTAGILPFVILIVLFAVYATASVSPLQKGMRYISNINVIMAISIMFFVMLFGPTNFILLQVVQLIGTQIQWMIPHNFQAFVFGDLVVPQAANYVRDWIVNTWLWWIGWTPFMAIFIANISKGRTLKEFAIATMTVPTMFMILWSATFSGSAMYDMFYGSGEIAAQSISNSEMSFFLLLEKLPFSSLTILFTLILIIFFLATTCTSASTSLSSMTGKGGTSRIRSLFWAAILAGIAVTGIFAFYFVGGNDALNVIKAMATVMVIPYFFFFVLAISAFIRTIRKDVAENRVYAMIEEEN